MELASKSTLTPCQSLFENCFDMGQDGAIASCDTNKVADGELENKDEEVVNHLINALTYQKLEIAQSQAEEAKSFF